MYANIVKYSLQKYMYDTVMGYNFF